LFSFLFSADFAGTFYKQELWKTWPSSVSVSLLKGLAVSSQWQGDKPNR